MENQKHIEAYQELFNHLHDEHGLILLQSEMDEIIELSENVKLKYNEASVGKEPSSVPQANELLPHVSIMLPKCTNCGNIMKVAAYECKCGIVKEG